MLYLPFKYKSKFVKSYVRSRHALNSNPASRFDLTHGKNQSHLQCLEKDTNPVLAIFWPHLNFPFPPSLAIPLFLKHMCYHPCSKPSHVLTSVPGVLSSQTYSLGEFLASLWSSIKHHLIRPVYYSL